MHSRLSTGRARRPLSAILCCAVFAYQSNPLLSTISHFPVYARPPANASPRRSGAAGDSRAVVPSRMILDHSATRTPLIHDSLARVRRTLLSHTRCVLLTLPPGSQRRTSLWISRFPAAATPRPAGLPHTQCHMWDTDGQTAHTPQARPCGPYDLTTGLSRLPRLLIGGNAQEHLYLGILCIRFLKVEV